MSFLKSSPTEGRKRGGPLLGSSRRAVGKSSGKTLNLFKWLDRHVEKCTAPNMTMRDPTISLTPSRRWPPLCPPPGLWCPWGPAGMDWMKGPLGHSPHNKKFPKGYPFLPGGASHQITKDHGLKGNPFSLGSEMVKWSVLPMVQERGAEWKHSGETPMDDALPPGHYLWLVPRVVSNQQWCYAPSLTAVHAGTGQWWQWGIGRGIWHWQ